jgi:hypothetical protein
VVLTDPKMCRSTRLAPIAEKPPEAAPTLPAVLAPLSAADSASCRSERQDPAGRTDAKKGSPTPRSGLAEVTRRLDKAHPRVNPVLVLLLVAAAW